ncbi:MAG: hypothetical protein CM15mP120_14160 [Pseudomonadota bacterium]|nr:MAG: hypothetical protein CM15mP120_14160 [Pseudomonadota bacterium]
MLLLRTDRLQPKQRSSAWFKALEKDGVVVLIWPLSAQEFPRWLQGRLQHKGLDLQTDALSYLAARVEGNFLAAAQELKSWRCKIYLRRSRLKRWRDVWKTPHDFPVLIGGRCITGRCWPCAQSLTRP